MGGSAETAPRGDRSIKGGSRGGKVVAILVSARLTNGADLRRRKILLAQGSSSSRPGLAVSVGLTNCAPVAPALIDEGARRWMGASNCTPPLPRTGRSRPALSHRCTLNPRREPRKGAVHCFETRETKEEARALPRWVLRDLKAFNSTMNRCRSARYTSAIISMVEAKDTRRCQRYGCYRISLGDWRHDSL